MLNENESSIQDKNRKYKPSKTGKIALGISIGSLSIGLLSVILTLFRFGFGFILIVVYIASNIIAMFSLLVLFVDIFKFKKINNLNDKSDSKMIIYLVLGIVIGFMWGKML